MVYPVLTMLQRREMSSAPELTHQRIKGRSRFYKTVTIREVVVTEAGDEAEAATAAAAGDKSPRWEILLDSRVLKTPGRRPLQVRRRCLRRDRAEDTTKGLFIHSCFPSKFPNSGISDFHFFFGAGHFQISNVFPRPQMEAFSMGRGFGNLEAKQPLY